MTLNVAIQHHTHYRFDRMVDIMPHIVRLRPAPHCRAEVHHYELLMSPASARKFWQQDVYGNHVARVIFPEPSDLISISVNMNLGLHALNPFDFLIDISASRHPFDYPQRWLPALAPYLAVTDDSAELRDWVSALESGNRETVDLLMSETRRTAGHISYQLREEPGLQSCQQTLAMASGSCRDSSWLLLQSLRCRGLAARFVSGYLIEAETDATGNPVALMKEARQGELHAWVEAFIPGAGWIGMDPTSGLLAGTGHIPLACAPDLEDMAPVTGSTGRCRVELTFHSEVKAL